MDTTSTTGPATTVQLTIRLSRTIVVEGTGATMAAMMGLTMAQLSALADDGTDWEPDDTLLSALADKGEVQDEEWDWEEIIPID